MDLASLEPLGKVAGIGGIAIGAGVMIVRALLEQTATLPDAQRAGTLRFIAFGAFAIGALGIVAWVVGSMPGSSVTVGPGGVGAGRDLTGNTITLAPAPPTSPVPAPGAAPAAKPP